MAKEWGGLRAPGGLQRGGAESQRWQQEGGSLDVCSRRRGSFFVTHRLSQPQIRWEPPRCPEEEKGPGSSPLLEDIKNEQTG